ncbi:MAG: CBS domain-containing protein [Oceanospirillaceae bacterium]|jgi:signal-transduction protein with cAMP-binding, CBS, and nucleotidyltransferase domain|uniref:CBS domain-containing protein n=1 Tax=Marinobacterium litorale TaxID=404770 RepID=UPI0003F656B4|nr:CBS domain-containing protein [Marinobacterium litorale]MBT00333.1 CBS domain-containing protein [Oceanospirillaceae bacterium]
MLVKDVMVRDVVTISPFATLREAMSLMKRRGIKSLVVDKNHDHDAYGLITYTNIVKTVIAESGDIDLLNVYDICAKPALTLGQSLAVRHAAEIMTQHRLKRILVVDDNQLVGLVTMNDMVEILLQDID